MGALANRPQQVRGQSLETVVDQASRHGLRTTGSACHPAGRVRNAGGRPWPVSARQSRPGRRGARRRGRRGLGCSSPGMPARRHEPGLHRPLPEPRLGAVAGRRSRGPSPAAAHGSHGRPGRRSPATVRPGRFRTARGTAALCDVPAANPKRRGGRRGSASALAGSSSDVARGCRSVQVPGPHFDPSPVVPVRPAPDGAPARPGPAADRRRRRCRQNDRGPADRARAARPGRDQAVCASCVRPACASSGNESWRRSSIWTRSSSDREPSVSSSGASRYRRVSTATTPVRWRASIS